ncbi:hypothetical protein KCP69_09675 [Salmonella enterica subsp. enterica]|nr:hypothetical protein KCP69_09675 [Salmonella enterica subsp. enterica]
MHRVVGIEIISTLISNMGFITRSASRSTSVAYHFSAGSELKLWAGNHHIHKRRDIDRFQLCGTVYQFRL